MKNNQRIEELQEAMKRERDRRLFERYQAILLYLKGYPMKEIAQIIGRSRETVSSYVKTYEEGGLDNLELKRSSGKPRRLTPEQEAQLVEIITKQDPFQVQLSLRKTWTLSLIIKYVEREWGHSYSSRGMSLLLKRIGIVYKRPNYYLVKEDSPSVKESG